MTRCAVSIFTSQSHRPPHADAPVSNTSHPQVNAKKRTFCPKRFLSFSCARKGGHLRNGEKGGHMEGPQADGCTGSPNVSTKQINKNKTHQQLAP